VEKSFNSRLLYCYRGRKSSFLECTRVRHGSEGDSVLYMDTNENNIEIDSMAFTISFPGISRVAWNSSLDLSTNEGFIEIRGASGHRGIRNIDLRNVILRGGSR
jgi:hypothetical protein